MRLIIPLKTRLFAMRLTYNTSNLFVVTSDWDGQIHVPIPVKRENNHDLIIGSESELAASASAMFAEKVTFI